MLFIPVKGQTIHVYTEEWPPFNFLDDNNEIKGIVTQNVKSLLYQSGLEAEFELVAWNRAYTLAINEKNTAVYTIFATPERETLFHWFCPIHEPVDIGMYRLTSRADIQIDGLSDAKKFVVGVVRGDYVNSYLTESGFEVNKNMLVSTDEIANIRQLLKGRVDLTAQSKQALYYRLKLLDIPSSHVTQVLRSIDGKSQVPCLAFGRQTDPAILNKMRDGFDRDLKSKGWLDRRQVVIHKD